jgi:hypothetical protein
MFLPRAVSAEWRDFISAQYNLSDTFQSTD